MATKYETITRGGARVFTGLTSKGEDSKTGMTWDDARSDSEQRTARAIKLGLEVRYGFRKFVKP